MHEAIRQSSEDARGCGYRKEGGLYLVSGGASVPCGKLPIEVGKCPTCGGGIKPARGWTWVDGDKLLEHVLCEFELTGAPNDHCEGCPLAERLCRDDGTLRQLCGLLWIGEKFYPTPESWAAESHQMGVSRRIPALPRGFKIEEPPFVLVAHRKGIERPCPDCLGGSAQDDDDCPLCGGEGAVYRSAIFSGFRPTAIEIIVSGEESDEEIEALLKRGLKPVKVTKLGETPELDFENGEQSP